ncbi:MAG: hypothetical protein ACN6OD_11900 [Alcaligenes sp.]
MHNSLLGLPMEQPVAAASIFCSMGRFGWVGGATGGPAVKLNGVFKKPVRHRPGKLAAAIPRRAKKNPPGGLVGKAARKHPDFNPFCV